MYVLKYRSTLNVTVFRLGVTVLGKVGTVKYRFHKSQWSPIK